MCRVITPIDLILDRLQHHLNKQFQVQESCTGEVFSGMESDYEELSPDIFKGENEVDIVVEDDDLYSCAITIGTASPFSNA